MNLTLLMGIRIIEYVRKAIKKTKMVCNIKKEQI